MAFIKENGVGVGDTVITTREISSYTGTFGKGTIVKIIGMSPRGYDLQDDEGNRIVECGFSSVDKIK